MEVNEPLEFTGDDVEQAIAVGLEQLGVGPGDVLVEVVEEPSRGVFGIGARPAKVRLKLLRRPQPVQQETVTQVPSRRDDYIDDDSLEAVPAGAHYDEQDDEDDEPDEPGEDGQVGKQVLLELLDHMGVRASVVVKRAEASRQGEAAPWLLDVRGRDVSLLIGRRGDTLSSLQFITRLITSRRLQRRANIIVDVGHYKSNRSDRLHQLALRMADQAVQQARTITLEPMPPNERRIIHMALRDREDVETRSTGEGDSRKVTIVPK